MLMSFILVIVLYVVFVSGSESVQGFFFIVCVYVVLPLMIQLSRREGWDSVKPIKPRLICVLVVVFFVSGELKWEVIVHFVCVGEIVDHHCLNKILINIRCILSVFPYPYILARFTQ